MVVEIRGRTGGGCDREYLKCQAETAAEAPFLGKERSRVLTTYEGNRTTVTGAYRAIGARQCRDPSCIVEVPAGSTLTSSPISQQVMLVLYTPPQAK